MMIAEQVKPKERGKSDFFSWQLYRWLKKNPLANHVYQSCWNPINGLDGEGALFIGYEFDCGYVHGTQLRQLCSAGAPLQTWAYGPNFRASEWVDISDSFWEKYLRIGVCAIHGDYAHKWNEAGGVRTCEHCNKVEYKHIELKPVTKWRNEPQLDFKPILEGGQ